MIITFLYIICISLRILLIYLSFLSLQTKYIYLCFSFFYAILGIGSFYHFITKTRIHGAFNQPIWWHWLRPIHGILFLITSYLIYKQNYDFIYPISFDIIISLLGHVKYHYIK